MFLLINDVNCWNSEDFELFDLVEEVNVNFYELLKLDKSASSNDIRKAYRRLSLQYHPDKNKDEGAVEIFRKIVAVSEILRDEEKRKRYDLILQNGLPDWRQPVYYYRRVRKMTLWELSLFLFALLTFGQYLLAWSIYWERKYELEEVLISRFRKKDKKSRRNKQGSGEESLIAEHINQLPKPRYQDLLPIRLISFFFYLIKSAPIFYQQWREIWLDKPKSSVQADDSEDDIETLEKNRRIRKKVRAEYPDYSCIFQPVDAPCTSESEESCDTKSKENICILKENNTSQTWTDIDILNLTKAMNKYPGGTSLRWEKISQSLNRNIEDVTAFAKQLKTLTFATHAHHSLQGVTGLEESSPHSFEKLTSSYNHNEEKLLKRKITKDIKNISPVFKQNSEEKLNLEKELDNWTQNQQKSLELALQQFPKGTEERWEKIAESVLGKSKEECMLRYKHLVELIKKKKNSKAS